MGALEQEVGSMLKEAISRGDIPVKSLAIETKYSTDAFYMAMKGKRSTPQDARERISALNILGGMALALEVTGYKFFSYASGDRHPQTLIRRVEKEDREADAAMHDIPFVLIDKQTAQDLSPEDRLMVQNAGKEICDRICADLNLVCELDDTFQLGLVDYLLDRKEKTANPAVR